MNTLNVKSGLMLATLLILSPAQASTIAIIDSGTDLNHSELSNKKWFSAKDIDDAVDNDDNGYIDDVNGWNFADSNNKLYDKKFLGTFSADTYKFFEVQTRILKGEGTEQDKAWMTAARSNQKLISELGVFGNFVHGTHVAGISAKNADQAKLMILKLIPTKAMGSGKGSVSGIINTDPVLNHEFKKAKDGKLLRLFLKLLASQQGKALAPIGTYVGKGKARVANCSFGTSTTAAATILGPILKLALRRDPTKEELLDYSKFFVSEILKAGKALVAPAPNTLFVMAAGNDGTNNDELPTSPANLKLDNTITVAATLGYNKLASFSNYGEKMVEVAAPGVGILSTIPGNQYLTVSGTSQAAPFVTNVVGRLVDENPALSNSDIKKLLMETSDTKAFLKGKVVSGGIVNADRAILAAKMSKSMELSNAIQSARMQVSDVQTGPTQATEEATFVLPLPSMIY
jgi:subtilisin family serine protease